MNRKFKKALSLILCLLMTLSIAAPAAVAADDVPVIYVEGFGGGLYKSDSVRSAETAIYPTGADVGAIIEEALEPCLTELANGLITDNYDKYCDELYNAVAPIYEDLILDKNGKASDGSGDGYNPRTDSLRLTGYSPELKAYQFRYDWRLSPLDIADDLQIYIDRVKAHTQKSKVALVGRCLGGNMISAYLAKYKDHAAESVDSVVMYVASSKGIDFLSALFAGEIVLDADNVDRFADFLLKNEDLLGDDDLTALVTSFVSFINEAYVLGVGTDALQYIVDEVKDDLVPRLVRACYGSFPSYWAMVTPEMYEQARDFIFKGVEDEYKGMIDLLNDYHNTVQVPMNSTMEELKERGMNFCIIAKYNIPAYPLYESADEQTDNFTSTEDLSFGATVAKFDKVLSDDYIGTLVDTKYLSPDHKIDASTCLFPDTTWFIKNSVHEEFPDCTDALIYKFINSNGTMDITTDEKYPQYMQYDAATQTLSAVESLDPEVPDKGSNENRFVVFIRFFTAIVNFFRRLFSGDFENLFG